MARELVWLENSTLRLGGRSARSRRAWARQEAITVRESRIGSVWPPIFSKNCAILNSRPILGNV